MILLTNERQWKGGRTAVAFGMFDGVHEGHAQLMRKANELAALDDLSSVVYAFSSHPMATYAPERAPLQLETRSEKIKSIATLGIDAAVLRPFDAAFAAQSPEVFVRAFVDALHPRHVVIGFNYSFGCKGAGKPEDMVRFGEKYGFETHIVPEFRIEGAPVSSTRVRAAIAEGDMALCERLLGRPYALSGIVIKGKQLGRTLDFPTANIAFPQRKAVPPNGVYAALAYVNGAWYEAAVNVGRHPTAPGGPASIEANLLDYKGKELYGCHMRLHFCWRVREERKFPSLDALREEVLKNREQVRAYFGERHRF